jgi:hypothetical protein
LGYVEQLALDLQKEFPGISGFSVGNLWRILQKQLPKPQEISNLLEII